MGLTQLPRYELEELFDGNAQEVRSALELASRSARRAAVVEASVPPASRALQSQAVPLDRKTVDKEYEDVSNLAKGGIAFLKLFLDATFQMSTEIISALQKFVKKKSVGNHF